MFETLVTKDAKSVNAHPLWTNVLLYWSVNQSNCGLKMFYNEWIKKRNKCGRHESF